MSESSWPALPLDGWRDTRDTLQMWTQVAGKISLALTPHVNHFWNITFQVTSRGLATPIMTHGDRTFTLTFDFIAHEVVLAVSDGTRDTIPMRPMTVADFYRAMMDTLHRAGLDVRIWTMPVEVPDPIRFELDTTRTPWAGSGGCCSRSRRSFRASVESSSASAARCTSSGAASTWRSRDSRAGVRRNARARTR
jgi:hypothetical protein